MAQGEVVERPHGQAHQHTEGEPGGRCEKEGTWGPSGAGVTHVMGAVHAAVQVAGPMRESMERAFSAWN